jgi:hypothetical protein
VELFNPASTQGCLVKTASPLYIAPARTAQETLLPTFLLLLGDVAIGADRLRNTVSSGTSIADVAQSDVCHCCVTVYFVIA